MAVRICPEVSFWPGRLRSTCRVASRIGLLRRRLPRRVTGAGRGGRAAAAFALARLWRGVTLACCFLFVVTSFLFVTRLAAE